jgi:4-methyl-5(b-hydroxyethyl)-thiazole monophosphate biosynthesis
MIALLLADGFEEIEALTPLDCLRRVGVDIETVGITGKYATGGHGITVAADKELSLIKVGDYDAVILPGGLIGTENIDKSPTTNALLDSILKKGGRIAAICAAPTVLGKRGLLRGKKAVCYPGMEDMLDGATVVSEGVVTDGMITTARGMGVALPFALELVRLFAGEESMTKLSESIAQ